MAGCTAALPLTPSSPDAFELGAAPAAPASSSAAVAAASWRSKKGCSWGWRAKKSGAVGARFAAGVPCSGWAGDIDKSRVRDLQSMCRGLGGLHVLHCKPRQRTVRANHTTAAPDSSHLARCVAEAQHPHQQGGVAQRGGVADLRMHIMRRAQDWIKVGGRDPRCRWPTRSAAPPKQVTPSHKQRRQQQQQQQQRTSHCGAAMPRMAVCRPSAKKAEVSTARLESWKAARMQFRACTLQAVGRASTVIEAMVFWWPVGAHQPNQHSLKTLHTTHRGHDSAVVSLAVASSSAMPRCSSTCSDKAE